MAKRENDQLENGSRRESSYRGRRIEVVGDPAAGLRVGGKKATSRLYIDGREIEFEETEDGVMSHQSMFKVYSSPFELAEDLIKQWGEREIQPADQPDHPDDGHDHDHDHDHDHGDERSKSNRRLGETTAGAQKAGEPRPRKRNR
jgi:hypothetical protein